MSDKVDRSKVMTPKDPWGTACAEFSILERSRGLKVETSKEVPQFSPDSTKLGIDVMSIKVKDTTKPLAKDSKDGSEVGE